MDNLQKRLASFAPSFAGMPVAKFYDLAIGLDIHAATLPASPVCPVPHIGMVFDVMAAVMAAISTSVPAPKSKIGSVGVSLLKGMAPSVKVHGQWVAQAGIPIVHLPAMVLHFPFPIVAPTSQSEMWMGSSTVLADGGPCCTQFHPALSCNTVGFIPNSCGRKGRFKRPFKSLVLPTSMLSIITSGGKPVLVGGPPTIDLFQLGMKLGLKGLGKTKLFKKIQDKIDDLVKRSPLGKLQDKSRRFLFGEPVDAATGAVFHTNTDFELPGPIPFVWERTYYSDAESDGALGFNWHHGYDMGIRPHGADAGVMLVRLSDGRLTGMPALPEGGSHYNRKEKLRWSRDASGYLLCDRNKLCYRFEGGTDREGYRLLSEIYTLDGHRIGFGYDSRGGLRRITDSRGKELSVDTDDKCRITRIRTDAGQTPHVLVRYRYDEAGNLAETSDALDACKYFEYRGHQLVKLTNQSGMSFYWEYEGRGETARCIRTRGDGGVQEYRVKYGKGVTHATDSLGHTTAYHHTPDRLVYKTEDPGGGITRYLYNEFEEVQTVVNPAGYATKRVYDEYGNPLSHTDENGGITRYGYDERQNLIRLTTPAGRTQSWKYDEYDRVVKRTAPSGQTLVYAYRGGDIHTITDERGNLYEFKCHETTRDLESLVYPTGGMRTWKHDDKGRVIRETDTRGNVTAYAYDAADNLIRMEEPDGNVHLFEYDASGNMVRAQDKLREVEFAYGPLGVMTSRKQGNRRIRFTYDSELRLRGIRNENGESHTFELDGDGRVVEERGFDGIRRRYLRDAAGTVLAVERPGGRHTAYRTDGAGNVLQEEHHDGSLTRYAYDADGLLLRAWNDTDKVTLTRDAAGRVTKEEQGARQITHAYDGHGNLMRTASSLGADIRYDYDTQGNLHAMSAADGWLASWQRDREGLELQRTMSGGVQVNRRRDTLGREVELSIRNGGSTSGLTRYLWGMGNRLLEKQDHYAGIETRYHYDEFDNLISSETCDGAGRQIETIYRIPDRVGNLYKNPGGGDRRYERGGRLTEDENHYYHYDCEGNLIFKEQKNPGAPVPTPAERKAAEKEQGITFKAQGAGWRYRWRADGMLESVTRPDGKTALFGYDALGRRTQKIFDGTVMRWLWNANTPLHEWTYPAAELPKITRDDAGREVSRTQEPAENVTTWLFEQGTFVPCGKITDGKHYSIIADYLGTPTRMYDENGTKVWDCRLDIYGKVANFEGDSLSDCPFRYQGQYEDSETGLYYNRFRYYDPDSGNYLSKDPIGLNGGMQLYGYVHDTNNWLDPLGLAEHITFPSGTLHPQTVKPDNPTGTYKIQATGYHHNDKVALYEAAGLKESFDSSKWISHHVSYDPKTNEMTMQLVDINPHTKTDHIGGVKDFEDHHKTKYNTEQASKKAKCH